MIIKVTEIREGDYIKADWLGSGWHKVYLAEKSYYPGKVHFNIEGFGNVDIYENETVEKQ